MNRYLCNSFSETITYYLPLDSVLHFILHSKYKCNDELVFQKQSKTFSLRRKFSRRCWNADCCYKCPFYWRNVNFTKLIYRDIKNYLGQWWSWIGKRPSQVISCDDFFGTNDWRTGTFFMSHRASFAKHTNTFCKACIKILRHYCQVCLVWEVFSKINFNIVN
jgi:hypothetical protein